MLIKKKFYKSYLENYKMEDEYLWVIQEYNNKGDLASIFPNEKLGVGDRFSLGAYPAACCENFKLVEQI